MRIALFQGAPNPLDVPGNLQRLRHQAQRAAERGAQLLVCPEMFLSGYNIGLEQVERLAEAEDGPSAMDVVEIAQAHRIAIVYGYPERADDGAIYNSVQLIDATAAACATTARRTCSASWTARCSAPAPIISR